MTSPFLPAPAQTVQAANAHPGEKRGTKSTQTCGAPFHVQYKQKSYNDQHHCVKHETDKHLANDKHCPAGGVICDICKTKQKKVLESL